MTVQILCERAFVGLVRQGGGGSLGCFAVSGPGKGARPLAAHVHVITRSGRTASPERGVSGPYPQKNPRGQARGITCPRKQLISLF